MIPLQAANLNLRGKKQTKTKNKRVIFRDFSEPVTQSPDLSTQSHMTSFLDERRTIYSVNAFPSWFMRVPSNQILYLFTYFFKKKVFILFFFFLKIRLSRAHTFFFFFLFKCAFWRFYSRLLFPYGVFFGNSAALWYKQSLKRYSSIVTLLHRHGFQTLKHIQ